MDTITDMGTVFRSRVEFGLALVTLIAGVDEFKGEVVLLRAALPGSLKRFCQIGTIRVIGLSTRREGAKLSNSVV